MAVSLKISAEGAIDFLSLGALIHRLDPGIIPFRKAQTCSIHVSGGEFNTAANLADCFRLRTAIATAMVDYPVGDLIAERVRAMGVHPFYKRFKHDGARGPNMATVYSDRGYGVRGPVVFYNRANEAAAQLKPGDFDWRAICAGGVRWIHSGGIFAALSDTTAELIIEAFRAAKAQGAIVSFDLNFREKLWNAGLPAGAPSGRAAGLPAGAPSGAAAGGGRARAQSVLGRIVEHVDVLVGNEEDLQAGLGIAGPEVASTSKLDPGVFAGMIEKTVARYPNIKVLATTLREVYSTNRHAWGAVAWIDGQVHVSPTCELDVHDRVGGGDGFAAGLFYGLLTGETPDAAVRLGWAHGALLTTYPGDTTMATLEEVRAFAKGGSARIQR
jgi:2-dehydro-3-deoxygluconokinase